VTAVPEAMRPHLEARYRCAVHAGETILTEIDGVSEISPSWHKRQPFGRGSCARHNPGRRTSQILPAMVAQVVVKLRGDQEVDDGLQVMLLFHERPAHLLRALVTDHGNVLVDNPAEAHDAALSAAVSSIDLTSTSRG